MANLIRNGKRIGFSTESAALVNYVEKDGSKTNLQDKINKLSEDDIKTMRASEFLLKTSEGNAFIKRVEGKSVQNGVPTPTEPIDIESVGDSVNLIPYPYSDGMSKTHNGITYTVNSDGSVVANGTATAQSTFEFLPTGTNETLWIKVDINKKYSLSGCPQNGSNTTYSLYTNYYDGSWKNYGRDIGNGLIISPIRTYMKVLIRIESGTTVNNLTFYPMLTEVNEDGTYPTTYVPYGNGLVFEEHNKNLIPFPYYGKSGTTSGVTLDIDNNGVIKTKGTATASFAFRPIAVADGYVLPSGTYRISGTPSGHSSSDSYLRVYKVVNGSSSAVASDYGNGANFTLSENTQIEVRLNIVNGTNMDGTVFCPMIVKVNEDGTYPTEFEKGKSAISKVNIEPLRSIGDVKDELILEDGKYKVIRRIGITNIAEKTISKGTDVFTISKANFSDNYWYDTSAKSIKFMSNMLIGDTSSNASMVEGSANFASSGTLNIKYSAATSVDELKTALANCYMVYILAIPIIEELTTEQAIALLSIPTYDEQTHIDYLNYVKPMTSLEYGENKAAALALKAYVDSFKGNNAYNITYNDTTIGDALDEQKQNIADLSNATFPDFDKANQIYTTTSTSISNYNFTAPSNGYIHYMAFKGDIMISYGNAIRIGVNTSNNTFASGGMLPIREGTTVKITGRATSSDGEVNAYFITE